MGTRSLLGRVIANIRGGDRSNPAGELAALAEFADDESIGDICRALISTRGEVSGTMLAGAVLARYAELDDGSRRSFFRELAERFDPDADAIVAAASRYAEDPSAEALAHLNAVVEPPRQELFRRLNQAPGATTALVRMRAELLDALADDPSLRRIDDDFRHLLSSWFNRGFLVLEPITWSSPADVLEKIIDYEAVHEIADWTDLRHRLEPPDRRCYAFFHPAMPGEPLVFVEVALTQGAPGSLAGLLEADRSHLAAEDADTAVFYSISNCQVGLRGVSFGSFLIKQVAAELARELPDVDDFVTLSPAPGFAAWLAREAERGEAGAAELMSIVVDPDWLTDDGSRARHAELVAGLAATYYVDAKDGRGRPIDPVARFHLGNGAELARINPQANLTPVGLGRSVGMMVNYRYDLSRIERNHEAYASDHEVCAAPEIRAAAADTASPTASPTASRTASHRDDS